jgi:ABC-type transporter Mla MlaB component
LFAAAEHFENDLREVAIEKKPRTRRPIRISHRQQRGHRTHSSQRRSACAMSSPLEKRTSMAQLEVKSRSKRPTIDLTEVSFIDTSGLATLVEILVATQERGAELTLSGLNEKVGYS